MSHRMSNKSISPRKRLHNESQSPTREEGEIRNSDHSRHNSISHSYSTSYKKPKYFEKRSDQKEITVDKCISKMIAKEIEKRSKNEKFKESEKIKMEFKKLKDEYSTVCTQLNEIKSKLEKVEKDMMNNDISNQPIKRNELNDDIDRKVEAMKRDLKNEILNELTKIIEDKTADVIRGELNKQNDINLHNAVEEMNHKDTKLDQYLEHGFNNNELINILENNVEDRIEAVLDRKLTVKQKEISFKSVFIPDSTSPKWLVTEEKCNELFKFCQGQVANFLIEYIPLLFDLPDIIAPLKRGYKKEETQAVITHFWKGTLSIDLISKEVEKEHSAQRYKTSRKIYLGLKNSDGVIMTNKGAIYECRWNDEMKKYVPKSENPDASNATLEWQLPKDLQKERYEKGKDYIIVAKNDDSNQTRICKIDLCNFDTKLLYTKRKYGNT